MRKVIRKEVASGGRFDFFLYAAEPSEIFLGCIRGPVKKYVRSISSICGPPPPFYAFMQF